MVRSVTPRGGQPLERPVITRAGLPRVFRARPQSMRLPSLPFLRSIPSIPATAALRAVFGARGRRMALVTIPVVLAVPLTGAIAGGLRAVFGGPKAPLRAELVNVPRRSSRRRQTRGMLTKPHLLVPAPLGARFRVGQLVFARGLNFHRAGFVLGDFGERIEGIDREQIGGGFGKMHGNKNHAHSRPLGHPGAQNDRAAP